MARKKSRGIGFKNSRIPFHGAILIYMHSELNRYIVQNCVYIYIMTAWGGGMCRPRKISGAGGSDPPRNNIVCRGVGKIYSKF